MKKIISSVFVAVSLFLGLCSCTKLTTEGVTRITTYPVLTLNGETTMIIDKGGKFEEPGYSAELEGEDVTDQVTVSTNLDVTTSGVYSIKYSIKNADGFVSSASRKLIVLDTKDAIEGIYLVDPESNRNGSTKYGGPFEILILNAGDGSYWCEDLLGGWYMLRAGYGSDYAMEAYLSFDESGKATLLESHVAGWGDSADSFDGSIDVSTGTFTYKVVYATDYTFNVTMVKE